jgi:Uncharacterised nucleotidyltransferase
MRKQVHLETLVRALRFVDRDLDGLKSISSADWATLLPQADDAQLTLPLGYQCRPFLPDFVQTRIDAGLARNRERAERITADQSRLIDAFQSRGIPYIILKGLAKSSLYSQGPAFRPQYDIDIYCPESMTAKALAAAEALGYEAVGSTPRRFVDHLPVMIRKTGFVWRGDYYDPDLPASLEIHFRFWTQELTGFKLPGLDQFWERRSVQRAGNLELPALHPVDALTFASLHLTRHLLAGNLKPYHVYEIAHFLNHSAGDDAFWETWRESAVPSCRLATLIAFGLAREWFRPRLNPVVETELRTLSPRIQKWFEVFGWEPLSTGGASGKSELWLQWLLADSRWQWCGIARRRLVPLQHQARLTDPHVPASKTSARLSRKRHAAVIIYFFKRLAFHVAALLPAASGGFKWWRASRNLVRSS